MPYGTYCKSLVLIEVVVRSDVYGFFESSPMPLLFPIDDCALVPVYPVISEKIKRICSKVGIRVMFRSGRTLRSLLTKVKPRTDPTDATGVVYRIPCMDCDRSYIGETCRTLDVRLKEHQRCCRNLESQRSLRCVKDRGQH